MSITAEAPYKCPVCKAGHQACYRFGGLAVLPCPDVKPAGALGGFFPKFGAVVVGAGIGVDEAAPKEPTADELRAQIAALEAAKTAPKVDPEAEKIALKAKLARLQGGKETP